MEGKQESKWKKDYDKGGEEGSLESGIRQKQEFGV